MNLSRRPSSTPLDRCPILRPALIFVKHTASHQALVGTTLKSEIGEEFHAVGCGRVGEEIHGGIFHGCEIYRNLFARRSGVHVAGFVAQFGFGFPETAAICLQARDAHQPLPDLDLVDEADIEFGGKTEAFLGRCRRPKHGFVEDSRENPAVNDAAEASVLGLRCEIRVHVIAFATESEAESVWIVRAANEAVARVGEFQFAHFMKTLSRRPTK